MRTIKLDAPRTTSLGHAYTEILVIERGDDYAMDRDMVGPTIVKIETGGILRMNGFRAYTEQPLGSGFGSAGTICVE